MSSARAFFFDPGASPPDPLHALSRAASSARSVRVARFAALARVFLRSALAAFFVLATDDLRLIQVKP